MKYKSKIYAEAIADLELESKSDKKKISDSFLKILQKNGDMKKAKEVISLAENLYFKKTGKRKVILEMARKIKNISDLFTKKDDVVKEKINPEIVAGIKIIINNEKQLDFSLKNKLDRIF